MNAIFKPAPRPGTASARAVFAASALLLAPLAAHAADAPLRTAVFPFELDDTSLQGEMGGAGANEQAHLALVDRELQDLLAKSGRYDPIPLGAVAEKAKATGFRTCDGCDVPLAREIGADVSVIGWVQKVSPLILNINVAMRDAKTGKVLHAGSVDIRGDTDQSWSRGLSYLMRHQILADSTQQDQGNAR